MSLLSICIPTKNRANYLKYCLDNLLLEDLSDVQIIIVDGNSFDITESIVLEFKEIHSNTLYYRSAEHSSIDFDILKSIMLSTSKFCWLMSDDDLIVQNGITIIKSFLSKLPVSCNGVTLNYIMYDKNMDIPIKTPKANTNKNFLNQDIYFNNLFDIFFSLGIHLGFLSSQIINKNNLTKIINNLNFNKTYDYWYLIYIIGKMNEHKPNWVYYNQKIIKCRSGNDSFLDKQGIYNRLMITYINYPSIIDNLFSKNSKKYNLIISNLVKYRLSRTIAVIKSNNVSYILQYKLFLKCFQLFRNIYSFWFICFPLFFIPNSLFIMTKKLYFYFVKFSRSNIKLSIKI